MTARARKCQWTQFFNGSVSSSIPTGSGRVTVLPKDTRGGELPRTQPALPEGDSGRGLLLVEALADRWGVERGPVPRKTVWAEVALPYL